jgi:hypothetical protein
MKQQIRFSFILLKIIIIISISLLFVECSLHNNHQNKRDNSKLYNDLKAINLNVDKAKFLNLNEIEFKAVYLQNEPSNVNSNNNNNKYRIATATTAKEASHSNTTDDLESTSWSFSNWKSFLENKFELTSKIAICKRVFVFF